MKKRDYDNLVKKIKQLSAGNHRMWIVYRKISTATVVSRLCAIYQIEGNLLYLEQENRPGIRTYNMNNIIKLLPSKKKFKPKWSVML
jgi:hypothetical protein